ncbi:VOC family protein [Candidatus Bathyarchaeota archaeon]|nr:VOC family protein [Candidatus Bathyarchaeota archaeon]
MIIAMKTKFTYVGIRVKDLQKSIDFYTKLLGMKVVYKHQIEQTKGKIVNLESENSNFVLELNYYEKDSPYNTEYVVGEGLDHLAFTVDDLDKAIEEAKMSGHPKILEIKTKKMRWAYIEDPNGIWIELFSE